MLEKLENNAFKIFQLTILIDKNLLNQIITNAENRIKKSRF